jgi:6-phosphogluconolactonase (cycloisomerase 2 family)
MDRPGTFSANVVRPNNVATLATGRFVVVAGEKSDTLSSYAIDAENGALKLTSAANLSRARSARTPAPTS